ncbi:IS66 family transposase, partial [Pseudomonas putida]
MTSLPDLDQLTPAELRALLEQTLTLQSQVEAMSRKIQNDKIIIEQLTHEIAVLKRHKYAKRSEQISPEQGRLLDDLLNVDLEAIEAELNALHPDPAPKEPSQKPKRAPLPAQLPRTVIRHEPDNTQCACGCALQRIGEDVSEKLDYTPGVFTVEQHVRGKWACRACETLIQAPVPAQVIDKGMPTAGLLAHVMVAKFADHLPLYRQEKIFGRAGLAIPRSTLARWVGQTGVQLQPLVDALREAVLAQPVIHADETPVQMLAPGEKKTHRSYVWAYSSTTYAELKSVVYDFSPSRAGEHARNFLGDWRGKLVCDDFAGYKASFEQGIVEVGCMAHARRKFFDLHAANKSQLAEQALLTIGALYEVERQAKDMSEEDRRRIRQ